MSKVCKSSQPGGQHRCIDKETSKQKQIVSRWGRRRNSVRHSNDPNAAHTKFTPLGPEEEAKEMSLFEGLGAKYFLILQRHNQKHEKKKKLKA